jgi:hypothetical protein
MDEHQHLPPLLLNLYSDEAIKAEFFRRFPELEKKINISPKSKKNFAPKPLNFEELHKFVTENLNLTQTDAVVLWEHWVGNGFKNNGKPMASWKHVASNWERRKIFFPSLQSK